MSRVRVRVRVCVCVLVLTRTGAETSQRIRFWEDYVCVCVCLMCAQQHLGYNCGAATPNAVLCALRIG